MARVSVAWHAGDPGIESGSGSSSVLFPFPHLYFKHLRRVRVNDISKVTITAQSHSGSSFQNRLAS